MKMNAENIFSKVSNSFFQLYRRYLIDKDRVVHVSESERYQALINKNILAREINTLYESMCLKYDNDEWQSKVIETLDLKKIYANVDSCREDGDDYQERLAKELLRYFKDEFFTWCDKPTCIKCDTSKHQVGISGDHPTAEESRFECSMVEKYSCNACSNITRFPRYNNPIKLLETRTGRCGEWCNTFILILKSFGFETRYIWNKEDHVWCEVYFSHLKSWVHLDPCEKSFNQPFIYSNNWNKSMSYVIAFGSDAVVDVSKRYILKNQLPRDQIDEEDLKFLTRYLTKSLRKGLSDNELYELACRDELERMKLDKVTFESNTKTAKIGRISGSADWKKSRREDGE